MTKGVRTDLFKERKKISIWKKIWWKLENVWTFISNIPNNIAMICQWIPILWNNWDWDYSFLYEILRYKMDRMSKYLTEKDRAVNTWQYAAQLKACVDIIDRLQEGSHSYTKKEQKEHEEKWGESIYELEDQGDGMHLLDIYTKKAREEGLEEQEREEQIAIYELGRARRSKDMDVLFRIMRKRIEYWWD